MAVAAVVMAWEEDVLVNDGICVLYFGIMVFKPLGLFF